VESFCRNIFNKQKAIHIRNFSWLHDNQNKVSYASTLDSTKFVLNLSKHGLTDSEEAGLKKGLNFLVMYQHPNLYMACAAESVVPKLPQTLGMEFRWKIRSMLENSKSSRPNMNKEFKAVRSLRLNKDIRILLSDKGKCTTVLDETEYKDKLISLPESRAYEPLPTETTVRVEKKCKKSFTNTKTALPADLK
jgi:hypothetical protein